MVSKNVDFGRIHNINLLLEQCKKIDKEFEKINLSKLRFYAVEIRYPDEFYIPTLEEAKESYIITSEVKELVLGKLKIDIKDINNSK